MKKLIFMALAVVFCFSICKANNETNDVIKERQEIKEYYNNIGVKCEIHYICVDDTTWKENINIILYFFNYFWIFSIIIDDAFIWYFVGINFNS